MADETKEKTPEQKPQPQAAPQVSSGPKVVQAQESVSTSMAKAVAPVIKRGFDAGEVVYASLTVVQSNGRSETFTYELPPDNDGKNKKLIMSGRIQGLVALSEAKQKAQDSLSKEIAEL